MAISVSMAAFAPRTASAAAAIANRKNLAGAILFPEISKLWDEVELLVVQNWEDLYKYDDLAAPPTLNAIKTKNRR
jgi:hypothetical protein